MGWKDNDINFSKFQTFQKSVYIPGLTMPIIPCVATPFLTKEADWMADDIAPVAIKPTIASTLNMVLFWQCIFFKVEQDKKIVVLS